MRTPLLAIICSGLLLGYSETTTTPAPDPPSAVVDLRATQVPGEAAVALAWTTPGLHEGSAPAIYDVRRSARALDALTWEEATRLDAVPTPGAPGTRATMTAEDLPEDEWFFALRSANEAGDWSEISNVVSSAIDATGPDAVDDLRVTAKTGHSVALAWTAPADPGETPPVQGYELRFSTDPITEETWQTASAAANVPIPSDPGSEEAHTVAGLNAGTTYYFALISTDAVSNPSDLSNVATATTDSEPTVIRITTSTSDRNAAWPRWAPDGASLVFTADWVEWVHEQVYRIPFAGGGGGGEPEQLTDLPGRSSGPTFSPDGSRIAFYYHMDPDVPYGVWIKDLPLDAEATELVRLVGTSFHEVAWSPDGGTIAYTDKRNGSWQIFLVDVGTGESTWIAGGSGDEASSPAWSPDASKIAYVGHDASGWHIWTMNADGTGRVRLTTTRDNSNPCWSPDGEEIVYSSYDAQVQNGQLWVIAASGGAPVQLTDGDGYAFAPAWSPDGNWIAYTVTTNRIKDVWVRSVE
ncbi:MAG: PD40 domain-containing protein [Candidatus Eisenbacteria bacterium]|uniref:PD40 domain-containing protein n=1 Tax=Eiseniibacteriota bacterium TaxID=2212470 RepID=A0A956NF28_UNCEI|nr:PD40 domain-containing protein [Candidatus Eisenbacteria bacterium]